MSPPDDSPIGYADAGVDLRRLAAGLGDLHGELVERITPLLARTADERERAALEGLAELRAHDVVTEVEVGHLTTIVRALVAPEGTPPERAQRVAAVQRELLETDAGPAALAIAGIAANRSSAAAKVFDEAGPGADIGDLESPGQVACAGGIIGATAGIPFGPVGVLAGAAAGAAIGYLGAVLTDS
jgi:hypothetical protein